MVNRISLLCVMITFCVFLPTKAWTHGAHFGGGGGMGHFGGSQFSRGGGFFVGGAHGSFGHATRFPQGQFFAPRRSFRSGAPFFSPGFSRHRFVFRQGFGPAGPPPLGAPGLTPFAQTLAPRERFPFFCSLHSFSYTNQREFFGHLNFAHHVPLDRAASFCQPAGNGLIFYGF